MKKYILVLAIFFGACSGENEQNAQVNFDKKAFFENLADKIIIPAYQTFKNQADNLDKSIQNFTQNPTENSLLEAQKNLKTTYLAWQACSVFEIGEAENQLLRSNLNTFPTNTTQIKSNIASGNYNLATAANLSAKGLPALDYLLHGIGTPAQSLVFFQNNNAKKYLLDLSAEIKTKSELVLAAWLGNYRATFINATGTDVGSSLGVLVNQINLDYEVIKNPKIGIPLGIKTLGEPLVDKTEAFYGGYSVELALRNLEAIQNLYLGGSGLGLDDYLDAYQAKYNDISLNEAIKKQFEAAKTALKAVPDPLSESIKKNPTSVNKAYLELQKQVVLLKTDMPSVLGVLITYQDSDGD